MSSRGGGVEGFGLDKPALKLLPGYSFSVLSKLLKSSDFISSSAKIIVLTAKDHYEA